MEVGGRGGGRNGPLAMISNSYTSGKKFTSSLLGTFPTTTAPVTLSFFDQCIILGITASSSLLMSQVEGDSQDNSPGLSPLLSSSDHRRAKW